MYAHEAEPPHALIRGDPAAFGRASPTSASKAATRPSLMEQPSCSTARSTVEGLFLSWWIEKG